MNAKIDEIKPTTLPDPSSSHGLSGSSWSSINRPTGALQEDQRSRRELRNGERVPGTLGKECENGTRDEEVVGDNRVSVDSMLPSRTTMNITTIWAILNILAGLGLLVLAYFT